MHATGKLFHEIWPGYEKVRSAELTISVGIVAVLMGTALSIYQGYFFRANLTEAYGAAAGLRTLLVEQLAVSGDPVEIPLAEGTVSAVGFDILLSGRARRTEQLQQVQGDTESRERNLESRKLESRRVSSAHIVGNTILVAGTISGRDYELRIYPAVADEETPSVYRWLCGGGVPQGWLAQTPASRGTLPNYLLSYDCRARKGA